MKAPRTFRSLLLLGMAICLPAPVCMLAQTFPLQSYTTRDGLPSNNVTALLQDSRGFLWIGTDNGLSVFNGATFTTIGMAEGLPNSYVTCIQESRRSPGTFWVGTIAGGLVKVGGDTIRTYRAGGNNVGAVCEDPAGRVWCVIGDSLYSLVGDSLQLFREIPPAQDLAILGDSTMIVAGETTLSFLARHSRTPTTLTLPLRNGETIAAMMVKGKGTILLALSSGSLVSIQPDGSMSRRIHVGFPVSPDLPSRLASDRSGIIWLTTASGLLSIAESVAPDMPPVCRRLAGVFGPLLVDREDIVWTGGPGQALMKIADRRLHRIPVSGLQVSLFNQVACIDSAGHIWMTTSRGLTEVYRDATGQWSSHTHTFASQSWKFGQLFLDRPAHLWTNAYTASHYVGLSIATGIGQPSRLTISEELAPALFNGTLPGFTFIVDRHHRAWCTQGPDLCLVDIGRRELLKRFGPEAGLPPDPPRALLFDRDENLWSGSWSTGLSRLHRNGGRFETFTDFAGIPGVGVRSLLEDAGGALWIGTRFGGAARYKNGVFHTVTVRDGLLSNAVWSLAETPHRIWLGTDVGLQSLDKATLKPVPARDDLLVGRVYASGAYREEFVWCITAQEVIVFESPEGSPPDYPPPIHLLSFSTNGVERDVRRTVEIPYDENTCVFEFVGVSFRDEKGVTYQYRMLGVDTTWSGPRQQRSVIFASLKPGTYRFEVRAVSAAGSTSLQPAAVAFTIVPPYWQRWWFIALLASLVMATLFALYRFRVHRLLEMERLRLRIAGDLHDDVGTNLSTMILASQIMERKFTLSEDERKLLAQLRSTAGRTQEMLKDIVWLLHPANDSLNDFVLKLKDIAGRVLQETPFVFHTSGDEALERVSMEFRRQLVMIFKESLNNIMKHSGASLVEIDIALAGILFTLSIHDNGRGFDRSHPSPGNGLTNLAARAAAVGGMLEILSAPGEGTTVRLSISITQMRNGGRRETSP